MDKKPFTVYCGNLAEEVTESLLRELFNQAGPVESVRIPRDMTGKKDFGFVVFEHAESVSYSIALLQGIKLYNRSLRLNVSKGVTVGPNKYIEMLERYRHEHPIPEEKARQEQYKNEWKEQRMLHIQRNDDIYRMRERMWYEQERDRHRTTYFHQYRGFY